MITRKWSKCRKIKNQCFSPMGQKCYLASSNVGSKNIFFLIRPNTIDPYPIFDFSIVSFHFRHIGVYIVTPKKWQKSVFFCFLLVFGVGMVWVASLGRLPSPVIEVKLEFVIKHCHLVKKSLVCDYVFLK